MISRMGVLVGTLAVTVVALAIALGVVLATEDDNSHDQMMLNGRSGYAGMMGAMGSMDSDAMLQHMREVLGEDGFKAMEQHIQAHTSGTGMSSNASVDQMMHTIMDGMMDEIGVVPSLNERHETPAVPPASPTAAR